MEPILNEQQSILRDSAVRLCKDFGGPKRARQLRNDGIEMDAEAWAELIRAGWLATAVPEEAGGLGMGVFNLSLLMEEAGRNLLMVPLAEAVAAAWAMARAEDESVREGALGDALGGRSVIVPGLPQESWTAASALPPAARQEQSKFLLDGKILFVPFGPSAQAFLIAAENEKGGPLLCLVPGDAKGLSITTVANVDGSSSSELTLNAVAVTGERIVARSDRAKSLIVAVRELLVLGTSAQLLGVSNAALDMTLEYIKFRQQFGKPLGSFQALQHRAADCFVDVELNRSLVYRVFSAWDAGQCHPAMVSATKARTTRSALEITRTALQMHGAIGYTDEHDIGLFYKRAIALAALYGNDANHVARFSRLTVDSHERQDR